MKPNLCVFANIEVDGFNAHNCTSGFQVTYGINHRKSEPITHPLGRSFRLISASILIFILTATLGGQTTIVAVRSEDSVVVAADSKQSANGAPFCKIRECGDAFLALAGPLEAERRHVHFELWPKLRLVCQGQMEPKERADALEKASVDWLNSVFAYSRQDMAASEFSALKTDSIISFVLVGWRRDSFIFGRNILGTDDGIGDLRAQSVSPLRLEVPLRSDQFERTYLGYSEEIGEYLNTPEPFQSLGVIKGAEFLVNTMIIRQPSKVRGPVDILLIDAKGSHWIQRKPECEETKKNPPTKPTPKPTRRRPRHL